MKDNLYVKERLNDGASTFDGYLLSRANWYSSCDMEYAMQGPILQGTQACKFIQMPCKFE